MIPLSHSSVGLLLLFACLFFWLSFTFSCPYTCLAIFKNGMSHIMYKRITEASDAGVPIPLWVRWDTEIAPCNTRRDWAGWEISQPISDSFLFFGYGSPGLWWRDWKVPVFLALSDCESFSSPWQFELLDEEITSVCGSLFPLVGPSTVKPQILPHTSEISGLSRNSAPHAAPELKNCSMGMLPCGLL